MNSLISAAMVFFFTLSAASALDFGNLQNDTDLYNNKIADAPAVLKGMIGNENVDFTILLNNGSTLKWGMEMEDAKIVRSAYGGLEKPTIEVYATEDALNKVLSSGNPMAAYQESEKSGQMKIDGKTFGADAKITVALSLGEMINPFLSSLRS